MMMMTTTKGLAGTLMTEWSDGLAVPGEREGWEERAALRSDAVLVVHVFSFLPSCLSVSRRRAQYVTKGMVR